MLLLEKVAEFKAVQHSKVPTVILEKLDSIKADIVRTGFLHRALTVDDRAPDFSLPNQHGDLVRLGDVLQNNRVVLSFFRGSWCTVDKLELEALKFYHDGMRDSGATVLAVSPERVSNSLSLHGDFQLPYDILYDKGSLVSDRFGLSYTMPVALRNIYDAYGIDISEHNGDTSFKLPVPASYVIDHDGRIRFSFAYMDHWQRVEPIELVSILKELSAPVAESSDLK